MELKENKPFLKRDLILYLFICIIFKFFFYYIGYHVVLQTP